MRRWLDMIASRQLVRRVVLDAGMHALAEAADFLPRMKQRMATCRLIGTKIAGPRRAGGDPAGFTPQVRSR